METYNLVNSIKGGCGKTTFSIWLSYYLLKEGKKKENGAEKTLLMDMDLLGTAMSSVFYGSTELKKGPYINDAFRDSNEIGKTYVREIELDTGECFYAVFASMRTEDRDRFRVGVQSNYSPVVKYSIFRTGLISLLKNNQSLKKHKFQHYVFDMPPNSDGFSDAAMECVFNKKYSIAKTNDKKNLFIMVGMDIGHMEATKSELKNILTKRDEMLPNRIFIVFNNNLNNNLKDNVLDNIYADRKEEFEKTISSIGIQQKEMENIYFLRMVTWPLYTERGINGIGLANQDREVEANTSIKDSIPAKVIESYARFGEEFTEAKEETLLNLMINEE